LAAGLASNIGFLEHFRTRLSEKPNALHHVSPNIPVIIAASSSARKSSLVKYITSLLTSAAAPEEFRDRHIFLVDATLKGIRTSLVNYQRCAVNSDEAVNTYSTPWSEPSSGVNYLPVDHLLAEDDAMEGHGGASGADGLSQQRGVSPDSVIW
jgi:hypothetical protein